MSGEIKSIRLSKCSVGEEEKAAVARVLDSEFLGMGKEVQAFELELQNFFGTKNQVICVNTGTAALHLALLGLDIGPGDEVLVPSITYVASYQAISATGAKAVSCDVNPTTGFLDVKDAERRITSKTKAIMPVHYASQTSGLKEVYELAKRKNLRVVEDAAHSFGGYSEGKRVGLEGDVICFSFDGIKNITSGEGGAVVTGDKKLVQRIQDARLLGVEKDTEKRFSQSRSWVFDVQHQGFRYHMSDIMAAIGREQLKKMDMLATKRKKLAQVYLKELKGSANVSFLDINFDEIVPHIFVVLVDPAKRDQMTIELKEKGIATGLHYFPNHQLSYYRTDYVLPGADKFGASILTLPLHPDLSEEDIKYVAASLNLFKAC